MKRIANVFSNLSVRWKLAIGSAMLLFLLITLYNFAEYLVIRQWVTNRERNIVQGKSAIVQSYFIEKEEDIESEDVDGSKEFLEKVNEPGQMIRIVGKDGKSILTVTKNIVPDQFPSLFVQTPQLLEERRGEEQLLIVRTPLVTPRFTGTIEIVRNIAAVDELLYFILTVMSIGGMIAVLLSVLGGMVVANQLLAPVKELNDTMNQVQKKGLSQRVQVRETKDEFTALARMFNTMMDKLERSFQQQKQFVEDASHELRTPIAILEGHISMLLRWGKKDPKVLHESLAVLLQETKRLKNLVQDLLAVSQAEATVTVSEMEEIEPAPIINRAVQNMMLIHDAFIFSMDIKALHGIKVIITANHLEQILLILLDNAVKYSMKNKRIEIAGYLYEPYACIEIKDYGSGIPGSDLPHIFDRFYRVDKARSRELGGSGLGLAIAKHLIQRYQGSVEVQSKIGVGTTFLIKLPIG